MVLTRESDVPVVSFVAQGNTEANAETADEIRVFVAIKDEGMRHADAVAAGVKIQADAEGEPLAAVFSAMLPVDFNHDSNGTWLLDYERLDLAREFFYARALIRTVLAGPAKVSLA